MEGPQYCKDVLLNWVIPLILADDQPEGGFCCESLRSTEENPCPNLTSTHTVTVTQLLPATDSITTYSPSTGTHAGNCHKAAIGACVGELLAVVSVFVLALLCWQTRLQRELKRRLHRGQAAPSTLETRQWQPPHELHEQSLTHSMAHSVSPIRYVLRLISLALLISRVESTFSMTIHVFYDQCLSSNYSSYTFDEGICLVLSPPGLWAQVMDIPSCSISTCLYSTMQCPNSMCNFGYNDNESCYGSGTTQPIYAVGFNCTDGPGGDFIATATLTSSSMISMTSFSPNSTSPSSSTTSSLSTTSSVFSPSSPPPEPTHTPLSTGAEAGIGVGAAVVVLIIFLTTFFVIRRRRRRPAPHEIGHDRISGRFSDISLSFFVITIPMLLFTGALLGLVFYYRIKRNEPASENLQLAGTQDEAGVYYIDLNATFLIFIASWSSSLAPLLVGFIVSLASYPILRTYLQENGKRQPHNPLTPYQLALTLKLLSGGGFGALWSWFKYVFGWRKTRRPQASFLGKIVSVTIIAAFLGFIVFLADTWLHLVTKTVAFTQITPLLEGIDYSLALLPECTNGSNSLASQVFRNGCSLMSPGLALILKNGSQSLQVLNNLSDSMTVLTYEGNGTYTYLGIPPSDSLSERDFTATTFGMQTQCKPVSNECHLKAESSGAAPFNCSRVFSGDVVADEWMIFYFNDSTVSSVASSQGIENPFYFATAALVNPEGGGSLSQTNLSEIVIPEHGGIAFVILCNTTVYDVEYDSVNGSVTRFVAMASNDSTANIWQVPMAWMDISTTYLQQAASIAAFSNSAQQLADKMALSFSQVTLAIGAQSVFLQPAVAAQERTSLLVARISVASFFTLVIANLLFVGIGVVLTSLAVSTSGGEIRDVQARLSIEGIVADRFEGQRSRRRVKEINDLFEEKDGHGSIGVTIDHAAEGGYTYKVWPMDAEH